MGDIIFELAAVSYAYLGRFPALDGVDLTIRAGEKISIIGANGTGKSTLLTLLDGLVFPDKGTVRAFGTELSEKKFYDPVFARDFRRRVGFVFQNADAQLFCPTVREDIVFGPLALGTLPAQATKRMHAAVELLGIGHLLDRAPYQLSVGEKRKVALATVLAVEPEVIILDEPTAGLDPLTTRHIIDMLMEAHARGKTIIMATHDLHIIAEVSDTVYIFDRSKKIVKSGRPLEVLQDNELLMNSNLIHIHRHAHGGSAHSHPHAHEDFRRTAPAPSERPE